MSPKGVSLDALILIPPTRNAPTVWRQRDAPSLSHLSASLLVILLCILLFPTMSSSSTAPDPAQQTSPRTTAPLNYELRHGINPIPPPSPGKKDSPEYRNTLRIHESYQRLKLRSFTIELLRLAGCFESANENPKTNDLSTPTHLLFQQNRWDPAPTENIGHGFPRLWDMSDDKIWDRMLPVLRLATLLLTHTMSWPWLARLFLCIIF